MTAADTVASAKAHIRAQMLARRASQAADAALALAQRAQAALLAHERWRTARCVALYMPARGEADTALLRADAWARGVEVLLPRCTSMPGYMDFVLCAGPHELAPGAYGIMEPAPHLPALAWDACAPDVLLLPGVAFDRRGYRLGFGGGYYDRALAHPALRASWRVGLAFGWQIVDALPVADWDCPVHCLCTEEGLTCL